MTSGSGRVVAAGRDLGAGFAVGSRMAITANHVVRDAENDLIRYVPIDGSPIRVERIVPAENKELDAALLVLSDDVPFLHPGRAWRVWRVASAPPESNATELQGTVTQRDAPNKRIQLSVGQDLGSYKGYSGSAVLDGDRNVVIGLLVREKPRRSRTLAGSSEAASVLFAVPIWEVIDAFHLEIEAARPYRFAIGLREGRTIQRVGMVQRVVSQLLDTSEGTVVLRGPPGIGKTVLVREVAHDGRVWKAFPDGIVLVRAGPGADATEVMQRLLGLLEVQPSRPAADSLAHDRILVIVDDVWSAELLEALRADLPRNVCVMGTTRGIDGPFAAMIDVGAADLAEAVRILARDLPLADAVEPVLSALAETLFRWPLLLSLAAALIHDVAAPARLLEQAKMIQETFPRDATVLDELITADSGQAPRSVDVLVRRTLDNFRPDARDRFHQLAVYPPGTTMTESMLADVWQVDRLSASKMMRELIRAGLAKHPEATGIELHDLIAMWLHQQADKPSLRHINQRIAELSYDESRRGPGNVTDDRARWLLHHLLEAQAWEMLAMLPTMMWRDAFLDSTGSDALFLDTLTKYAAAISTPPERPNAAREAARAMLLAAHVRGIIRGWPVPLLVTMALVESPANALVQAAQHPREAMPAIAAIAKALPAQRGQPDPLDLALKLLIDQKEDDRRTRSAALGTVIGRLAARDVGLGEAVATVVSRYTGVEASARSHILLGVANAIAAIDRVTAMHLLDEAERLALALPFEDPWAEALRDNTIIPVAAGVAGIDPTNPELVSSAVALAKHCSVSRRAWSGVRHVVEVLANQSPVDSRLLSTAESLARSIHDEDARIEARAAVAPAIARLDPGDQRLVARAIRMARAISRHEAWAPTRPGAIAAIATQLAETRQGRVMRMIDEAVTGLRAITDDAKRVKALATLAAQIAFVAPIRADEIFEQAANAAMSLDEGATRIEALATVALRMYPTDPDRAAGLFRLARRSISASVAIRDTGSNALPTIARGIAAGCRSNPEAIDRAVRLARSISDQAIRAMALANVAEQVAPHDQASADRLFAETIDLMGDLGDSSWNLEQAAAEVAERLAASDPTNRTVWSRAVGIAERLLSTEWRARSLAGIASRIALSQPATARRLFAAAEHEAATMADDSDGIRDGTLAYITERSLASGVINPAAISRAETRLAPLRDRIRHRALLEILEEILADPVLDGPNLDEALRLARLIATDDLPDRASRALASVAARLADSEPERADAFFSEASVLAKRAGPYRTNAALAFVAGCRRDLVGLLALLKFDVEFGQLERCLTIMQHFVEGAERADSRLTDAVCTGIYLALFESAIPRPGS